MRVLLLGPIGSGKSTQARILSEHLRLRYIRSGDLVREKAHEDSPEGEACKKALESGHLAPDRIVARLVKDKIKELANARGFIFDGYIRRLSQLEVFDPHYDQVIYLKVPEKVIKERLLHRNRSDDTPQIIEERLKVYHEETEPLIKYFKRLKKLVMIDASGGVEQITQQIENHFKKLKDEQNHP